MVVPDPDSAVIAWVAIVIFTVVYVVVYDVWAHLSGNLTMSAQMTRWLYGEAPGPFIVAAWVGSFVGLLWHFLRVHR